MSEAKINKAADKRGRAAVEKKASALQRLVVEYVEIDSIKPNSYNPNRQSDTDFALLQRSMTEDGFTQPIVVQRATREIVDGEHRWRAGRALGLTTVPAVFVDMTDEQMRIATLRHNRARGSEDLELSTQLLRDLRELGALDWAADSLGIGDEELSKLLDAVPAAEALASDTYSEAWTPSRSAVTAIKTLGSHQADDISFTPRSEAKHKEFAEKIEGTKNEAERMQMEVAFRQTTYRVVLSFRGDEAALVRRVLGDQAAGKIVELCRARKAVA